MRVSHSACAQQDVCSVLPPCGREAVLLREETVFVAIVAGRAVYALIVEHHNGARKPISYCTHTAELRVASIEPWEHILGRQHWAVRCLHHQIVFHLLATCVHCVVLARQPVVAVEDVANVDAPRFRHSWCNCEGHHIVVTLLRHTCVAWWRVRDLLLNSQRSRSHHGARGVQLSTTAHCGIQCVLVAVL
jgi:hypothetical protein